MNAKEFWNKRADAYDASVKTRYADAYQCTIEITKKYLNQEQRVLAFACGTGIVANEIAADVQHITGIDISDQMIAHAGKKASDQHISNITYHVTALEDEVVQAGHFDVITAFNVLYFLPDLKKKLRLIHAMLPEGGYFLSVTDCLGHVNPVRKLVTRLLIGLHRIPYMHLFTPEQLISEIKNAGFTIITTENLFHEPPNVYIVAQK